jgi:hypothetical protein
MLLRKSFVVPELARRKNSTSISTSRFRCRWCMPCLIKSMRPSSRWPHSTTGSTRSKVEAVIDPQTLRVFATPQSRASHSWPASVLNNLLVTRPKAESKKDPTDVELRFSTTVKVTDDQLVWAKNHIRKFFFAEFEVTQGSLVQQANKARGQVQPIDSGSPIEQQPGLPIGEPPAEADGKAAAANDV